VLKWCGYPEPSLPAHFDPKKLAILDLSMSFFSFDIQPITVCLVANYPDIYLVLT